MSFAFARGPRGRAACRRRACAPRSLPSAAAPPRAPRALRWWWMARGTSGGRVGPGSADEKSAVGAPPLTQSTAAYAPRLAASATIAPMRWLSSHSDAASRCWSCSTFATSIRAARPRPRRTRTRGRAELLDAPVQDHLLFILRGRARHSPPRSPPGAHARSPRRRPRSQHQSRR